MSLVAAVQMNSTDDVAANLRAVQRLLEQAAQQGAVLAVLPENFAFMGARDTDKLAHREAEGAGPIQTFLAETAARLKLWIIAGTMPLAVPGKTDKVYAASLVYDAQGRRVAHYDKIHLFDVDVEVPRFAKSGGLRGGAESPAMEGRAETDESHLSPRMDANGGGSKDIESYRESASMDYGEIKPTTVTTPHGIFGLSVCYDLRFPELYRSLSASGAQVLCVPSAFTEKTGEAHWEILLRARAVENLCFVIAPNQCGTHAGGRRTWGHTMIISPWGEVIAQRAEGEGIVLAELDYAQQLNTRNHFPSLTHRRL